MTNNIRDELMHSDGTTPYETFSIIVPSFFIVFLFTLLTRDLKSDLVRLLLEFILIVIPLVLIMTVLAQYATMILAFLMGITVSVCFILTRRKGCGLYKPTINSTVSHSYRSQLHYLTAARSTINILSVIAILAVDFRIFPRTFTKTLTYGYSLMDTGVGLYVCSNGVLAPELRGYKNTLTKTLKSILPLMVLGGLRIVFVKEVDYYVAVTEYGVHWNFFLTLAAIKLLSSLILKFISVENSIYSAVLVLLIQEIILQLGAAEYVLSNAPRDNFFSANREGIVSSLGYTGIYLLSLAVGHFIKVSNTKHVRLNIQFMFKLFILTIFFLWSSVILEKNFKISRRLVNSAYCIWILFVGNCMLTLFYMGEMVYDFIYNREDLCKVPLIYEGINYNGLIFFLLANVLTGLINVTIDTLQFGTFWGLCIVIIYMFINCGTTYLLYVKQIKLKL